MSIESVTNHDSFSFYQKYHRDGQNVQVKTTVNKEVVVQNVVEDRKPLPPEEPFKPVDKKVLEEDAKKIQAEEATSVQTMKNGMEKGGILNVVV